MTDKNSLLASLTGEQVAGSNGEQDLFGDCGDAGTDSPLIAPPPPLSIPIVGASLPPKVSVPSQNQSQISSQFLTPGNEIVDVLDKPQPALMGTSTNSLLSKSRLLGVEDVRGVGDGLFDDVDAEEQKKTEEEKLIREQEEERVQKEMKARQLHEAEEARRQEEEHYRQMQQEQLRFQNVNQQSMISSSLNHGAPGRMSNYQHQPVQTLDSQMRGMTLVDNTGFYREHNTPITQNVVNNPQQIVHPGGPIQNSYYYGTKQQPLPQGFQGQSSFMQPQPSTTAGMHNAMQSALLGKVRQTNLVKPQDVAPLYTEIRVTEPMLIQTQSFLINSPPYWSYQITSYLSGNQGPWIVRRRFRHVVALEDRLRISCPGSILPPRPDKHATRALEEASTQQSAEFAVQRAKELELYLNLLAKHPTAGQSQALRLFLGLQDDIGTAWPEVSTHALTRLGAVGAGMSMKVADTTNLTAASAPAHEWEEDAELLALCGSENLRLGAVSQAVPKLEGAVILFREQGDAAGALGMELSKASKMLDMDFKMCEILSNGLLRHGRRTKRLALEMGAAMDSFLQHYKLVRYEKMAMHDRRQAIQKKAKERGRADSRAFYLSQQQRRLQVNGHMNQLGQLEQNAIFMDGRANDAVSEADEIGARLKSEIHRVAISRRSEWNASMKNIAKSMKNACTERAAIWEATLEAFENLYKSGSVQTDLSHLHS